MDADLLNPSSYSFNLYAVPNLITALAMFGLGLVVVVSERYSRVSIAFFVMIMTATVWLFSYAVMYCAQTTPVAAVWARVGHIGITFIPAAVYHFTVETLQLERQLQNRIRAIYLACAAFCATVLWTDGFFQNVRHYWWGYYPQYNWVGVLFIVFFFCLMALSLRHYWTAYHTVLLKSTQLRSKALFTAFCIAYLASIDYLATFEIPLYPFGHLPVLGFVALVALAIRRYRLVDITPAFAAKEIIHAMDDALLVLDSEGVVRVANGAASRMFERSPKELEGMPMSDLAKLLNFTEAALGDAILLSSARDIESVLHTQKQGEVTVSISSYVMKGQDAQPVASVCIIRDISERKKSEQEIQRHTELQAALYEINLATTSTLELRAVLDMLLDRLSRLVPNTAVTIMLLNREDGKLIKVGSRGIDEAAWKADDEEEQERLHAVLEKKDALIVPDIQLDGQGLHSKYFRRNGYTSFFGIPLLAKHEALGVLSFYSRSARGFSDAEINFVRSLAGQAAAAIDNSQLYEQTKRQAIELEQANRVKNEFLGVMSHELRTPLNVISGYTKIVQEGVMGEVSAEQSKALGKVIHHADELMMMVNSIMDATRIEVGAVSVDCNEFSLAGFATDLKSSYEYPLGKPVSLKWDWPPDLPDMRSDRDKLKHILQNLINNALKFTEEGFVTISVRHVRSSDTVEFTVTDTGVGIATENLPLIFERFRQLDSSQTRTYGGVGLGLHIVKTFVGLLAGSLNVSSTPGQGSTFIVSLPRLFPEAAPPMRTNPSPAP